MRPVARGEERQKGAAGRPGKERVTGKRAPNPTGYRNNPVTSCSLRSLTRRHMAEREQKEGARRRRDELNKTEVEVEGVREYSRGMVWKGEKETHREKEQC